MRKMFDYNYSEELIKNEFALEPVVGMLMLLSKYRSTD